MNLKWELLVNNFFVKLSFSFTITDIEDEKERVQAVFAALDKLPQLSHDLMERIVFHLSK